MGHSVGCAAPEVKARIGANRGDEMSSTKHCPACDRTLPITEFRREIRNGKNYPRSSCIECCAAYNKTHHGRKLEEKAWNTLMSLVGQPPCAGCFRRDRCAAQPAPCHRFDLYVEKGVVA